jgi:hypothetical protein
VSDGWNLVAAGPSRARLTKEHLLPDAPVVTVNRAIDILDLGLPVHFAAFADGPKAVWEPLDLKRHVIANPTVQLWVSLRHVTAKRKLKPTDEFEIDVPGPPLLFIWDQILPASVGVRVLPHGNVEDVHRKGTWRHAFTTICALERIYDFAPKRIRILCADMSGPWIPGKTEKECMDVERMKVVEGKSQAVLDRWAHERSALYFSIEQAKKKIEGLVVEWVTP